MSSENRKPGLTPAVVLPAVLLWALLLVVHTGSGAESPATARQPAVPHGQSRPPGPPLSPEQAIAKMTVPDGFRVELVAAEPEIVNPVALAFDARGRAWITESLEYPRNQTGAGRDRIKILEDTDGDGRADKFTLFAEGLNIPSGIAVGYGGVWVANAPDILFLRDTDGDDRADGQEVVVTGFGRADTHELPNSLTWGPDGYLYGLNGVFNPCHVRYPAESPHHDPHHPGWRFTCALFRIDPRTKEFEVFAEGTSNPWGIAWNPLGEAFLSACVIDHLWHISETGYYHRQGGPYPPFTWKLESIVQHKHQAAAYCGIHYFDSDAYPAAYRDRLYMGNIHGNCINVDVLADAGASYAARPATDFLSANDAWFMPVVQKTGPDGCLWILDWYDRYHCYQDARRDPKGIDRLKGRLYRVRHEQTAAVPRFNLDEESDEQLVARLQSANVFFRDMAQRILAERADPSTRPLLESLALNVRATQKSRLHAVWALIGSGPLEANFHATLLEHPSPAVRAWGVRAAGNQRKVASSVQERLHRLVAQTETDPRVLLQLAVAARKMADWDAIDVLVRVLERCGDDPLLPPIVWQNLHPLLAEQAPIFLARFGRVDLATSPAAVALAPRITDWWLSSRAGDVEAVATLLSLLLQGGEPCASASGACLDRLAQRIQTGEVSPQHVTALRDQLAKSITPLIGGGAEDGLSLNAAYVAAAWGHPPALEKLVELFGSDRRPGEQRVAALRALVQADRIDVVSPAVTLLADAETPIGTRADVLAALGGLDTASVARSLLAAYGGLDPQLQPRVIELLSSRVSWSRQLLEAVGRKQIPTAAIHANQAAKLLASPDEQVRVLLGKHWGTVRTDRDPQRAETLAEMRQLLQGTTGDALQGRQVFQKVCGQCHRIYGEGQDVGPDITRNGRGSFEQLLSNVFDPNLVIGAGYQPTTVVTTTGQVFTGLLVEEGPQRIVLSVQGGKQETIPAERIEERSLSRLSLMPEGVEKQLTKTELIDLFAFLTLDRPPEDPQAQRLPGTRPLVAAETTDRSRFAEVIGQILPGFHTEASGAGGIAVVLDHFGRPALRTHPLSAEQPCLLKGALPIPQTGRSLLRLDVAHHARGDWRLVIRGNGQVLHDAVVSAESALRGWREISIDVSQFRGRTLQLELENRANNWSWEFGWWGGIELVTEESE